MLRPLLESDSEGEEQGRDQGYPLWVRSVKREEESPVDEERENPKQEEMSDLVSVRELIDISQRAEMTRVGENDDEDDQEREYDSEDFQVCTSLWEIDFFTNSIPAALMNAMAFSSVR